MDSPPTKEYMTNFWQNNMINEVDQSPEILVQTTNDQGLREAYNTWRNKEVLSGSQTISGLTALQLKAVPLEITTRIFNLFLVCGRLLH